MRINWKIKRKCELNKTFSAEIKIRLIRVLYGHSNKIVVIMYTHNSSKAGPNLKTKLRRTYTYVVTKQSSNDLKYEKFRDISSYNYRYVLSILQEHIQMIVLLVYSRSFRRTHSSVVPRLNTSAI